MPKVLEHSSRLRFNVRHQRLINRRHKSWCAEFREVTLLDNFDFSLIPMTNRGQDLELATGTLSAQSQECASGGPPGVWKSHLVRPSVARGCSKLASWFFFTAPSSNPPGLWDQGFGLCGFAKFVALSGIRQSAPFRKKQASGLRTALVHRRRMADPVLKAALQEAEDIRDGYPFPWKRVIRR